MLDRMANTLVLAALIVGCTRSDPQSNAEAQVSSAAAVAPSTAPPPAVSNSAVEVSSAAPDVGTPKRVERADGITITETTDGRITVKTTTLWNEALDTTYATCDYYRGAVPVLKRQLTPERGKLLEKFCDADKPSKPEKVEKKSDSAPASGKARVPQAH